MQLAESATPRQGHAIHGLICPRWSQTPREVGGRSRRCSRYAHYSILKLFCFSRSISTVPTYLFPYFPQTPKRTPCTPHATPEEELEELKSQHQLLLKAGVEYRHQVDMIFSLSKDEESAREAEVLSLRQTVTELRARLEVRDCEPAEPPTTTTTTATPETSAQLMQRVLSVVEDKKNEASTVSELEARVQQHIERERALQETLLAQQKALFTAEQDAKGHATALQTLRDSAAELRKASLTSEAERSAAEAGRSAERTTAAAELQQRTEALNAAQTEVTTLTARIAELEETNRELQTLQKEVPQQAQPQPQPQPLLQPQQPSNEAKLHEQLKEAAQRYEELSTANLRLHTTVAGNAETVATLGATVAELQKMADVNAGCKEQCEVLRVENDDWRRKCASLMGTKEEDCARADGLDGEVLTLSSQVEQLGHQLQASRDRVAAAEEDAHRARHALSRTHTAASDVLYGSTETRIIAQCYLKLRSFVLRNQNTEMTALQDDLRFRLAQVSSQHFASEEARESLGEQIKAVTSEIRVMHLEKEAVSTAMHSASSRHKRRVAAVQRSAVALAHRNAETTARSRLFAMLLAHTTAARGLHVERSRCRSLEANLDRFGDTFRASEQESAARCDLLWHEGEELTALHQHFCTAGHTIAKGSYRGDVAVYRSRAAFAMAVSCERHILGSHMRKLREYTSEMKHERARARDKIASRKALDRAADELAAFDKRLTQQLSGERAASMLTMLLETTKALQARALRRWSMWNTHRRALRYVEMERTKHREGMERATDELLAAEKRFRDYYLQYQTANMIRMQREKQTETVRRYYNVLQALAATARRRQDSMRLERMESTVGDLQDESRLLQDQMQEMAEAALSSIAQHAAHRLRMRHYAKWRLCLQTRVSTVQAKSAVQPHIQTLQKAATHSRVSLLRAGWLLRWMVQYAERKATTAAQTTELALPPLREELRAQSARTQQLEESLLEANSERSALQTVSDELRGLLESERKEPKAMQKLRTNQAQCIELGNSLAKLEGVLASKRNLAPAEQWTDVMLFVQAARGWWKVCPNKQPTSFLYAMR